MKGMGMYIIQVNNMEQIMNVSFVKNDKWNNVNKWESFKWQIAICDIV